MEISKLLKELRQEKGWTQKEIANALYISQSTYSKYENKPITIPLDIFCMLADLYDVSLEYLAGREN